ncbi:hypothetical protein OCU04_001705 [Sclerotinia nivalis]|uniref:Uncharacterized protein n=1 Tax=Sclerotinia nivalis TaxID=352851 RepID=A0A9X0AYP0_9HELO|nr:hypothetical protein OCU04_001705 [Sclerotinia nivalis]
MPDSMEQLNLNFNQNVNQNTKQNINRRSCCRTTSTVQLELYQKSLIIPPACYPQISLSIPRHGLGMDGNGVGYHQGVLAWQLFCIRTFCISGVWQQQQDPGTLDRETVTATLSFSSRLHPPGINCLVYLMGYLL